jgi:hypothetical protein
MAKKRPNYQGERSRGITREPLVDIQNDSNARPATFTHKFLPTVKFGSRDMDRNSPRGKALEVTSPNDYYLDSGDNRSK